MTLLLSSLPGALLTHSPFLFPRVLLPVLVPSLLRAQSVFLSLYYVMAGCLPLRPASWDVLTNTIVEPHGGDVKWELTRCSSRASVLHVDPLHSQRLVLLNLLQSIEHGSCVFCHPFPSCEACGTLEVPELSN